MKKDQIAAWTIICFGMTLGPALSYYSWQYLLTGPFKPEPVEITLKGDQYSNRIELLETGLKGLKTDLDECRSIIEANNNSFNAYTKRHAAGTSNLNKWVDTVEIQRKEILRLSQQIKEERDIFKKELEKRYELETGHEQ